MTALQLITEAGMALIDGFGLRGWFTAFVAGAIFLTLFGIGMSIFRNNK